MSNAHAEAVRRNMLALKKKTYEIKFELDGTSYTPIENIGSGAYGVVCSAIHKKTQKKVAIKKIPNIFEHIQLATRTYREIKILLHFNHDNIISIREILTPCVKNFKDVYIVLDLMQSDLHQIIHTNQPLTNEHACYFLYQILRGLKYIHSANVIHRDLKPANLLVNADCDLKIGDFGMARGLSSPAYDQSADVMTQYVATRWYRAPELILSMVEYSRAVDVWSVGCIFAEMLVRKQLFTGSGHIDQLSLIVRKLGPPSQKLLRKCRESDVVRDIIEGITQKGPIPLKTLFPKATNKARDLLGKMLTLDPDERIKVEEALEHPYLSKYHDPDDEPSCIPAFDFDFEKEKMNKEQLKAAILDEIAVVQRTSSSNPTFELSVVPQEELVKTTPKKSCENSATTPRTAAAIKQIEEIAKLQQVIDAKPTSDEQVVPSEPTGGTISLKVDSDKMTDDVEMLSAKSRDLRISSPPPHQLARDNFPVPSSIPLTVTSVTTLLTPRATDVDMPSAKREEPVAKEVKAMDSTVQEVPKVLDAKALIKAAILNGRKPRSVSESDPAKPRITALQRQREREDKRKKKLERAIQKKKKQVKEAKPELTLSTEDRSMLERWSTMQQKTKPFVHPIRSHMEDIINLRQTENTAPKGAGKESNQNISVKNTTGQHITSQQLTGQNIASQNIPSQHMTGQHMANQHLTGQHLASQQSQSNKEVDPNHPVQTLHKDTQILQTQVTTKPVACLPPTATVYNNIGGVLSSSFPQPSANIPCPTNVTTSTPATIQFAGPALQRQDSGLAFQTNNGTSTQTVTVVQVAGLPTSIGGTTQTLPVVRALHQLGSVAVPVGGVLQHVGEVSHPVVTTPQPVIGSLNGASQQIIQPTQPVVGASQQVVGVSQPVGVASQMSLHPQTQLTSQHTHTITTTVPQVSSHPQATNGWGVKLSNLSVDLSLAGAVPGSLIDTPITAPAMLPFSKQNIDATPQPHCPSQPTWPSTQTVDMDLHRSSSADRLPSYSEALQAKTAGYQVPLYNQVSVEGTGPTNTMPLNSHSGPDYPLTNTAHPMTSNIQPLSGPKDTGDGVTLSLALNKEIIDSSMSSQDWPLLSEHPKLSPTNCGASKVPNTLKVSTLTKLFHKSHVDDLTLAATPKGTGEGYGVGLDFDSLLRESLPMDSDQESTRASEMDPLSASLLADWQELSGLMNPGVLEELGSDLDMGDLEMNFPSPPITTEN